MVYVGSIGLGIPPNHFQQEKVKNLASNLFDSRKINRLLPVFENSKINSRQLVVDTDWIKERHSLKEANDRYFTYAKKLSLEAIDQCLTNNNLLRNSIPYEAIDMITFVSSTGIATPSVDAHLLNERPFREDVVRMPLWGLGCAGGAIGLSRASEWVRLHPTKTAIVICCELCSLTFQKDDQSNSNIVGTALFGDGTAAVLLIGSKSPYRSHLQPRQLIIKDNSSYTKKNSTKVMGWEITDNGFEVVFSKRIPRLVHSVWKKHVDNFLSKNNKKIKDFSAFIAHPGGRKVLEEMEIALNEEKDILNHSYHVLKNHGNMSSATVLYVLKEWMHDTIEKSLSKKEGIVCALGPGFSSELLLVEWVDT